MPNHIGRPIAPPPPNATTLIELFRNAAAADPQHPLLLAPDRESLALHGLLALVEITVGALNALGLHPGHRVIIAIPSSVEAAAVYLALVTGFAILPLSPDLGAAEYERAIRHIEAAAVVVQRDHPSQARGVAERWGVKVIEIAPVSTAPAGTFAIIGAADLPEAEPHFAGPDDLSMLLHTSGTTGLPKIVPSTHRESMERIAIGLFAMKRDPKPNVNILPLYRIGGVGRVALGVATRESFSFLADHTIDEIYRYLALYQPNTLNAVPAILDALVREAPRHEAELRQFQLQTISVASATLPDALLHAVRRTFGAAVQIMYGVTEAPLLAGTTWANDDAELRPGSVGKPPPITEILITDEAGEVLPQGEVGEIVARSLFMFTWYLDNPEANAAAFRDGWFRTGDAGYVDAEGYLYLVGRI